MGYGLHKHSFCLSSYVLVVAPSKRFLSKLGTGLSY
nr:MAG TPA: hypothetical protein [Herelleviridae sp.]